MKKNTSVLTIIGIVLGVIALLTSFIPIINNGSFILGAFGLILSAVGFFRSQKKVVSLVSIIICVVACGLVLSNQASLSKSIDDVSKNLSGKNTEELLEKNVDVEIGKFSVKKEFFMSKPILPITVKNKSDEKKSYHIEIEAVDQKGVRIEKDSVYANDLKAKQSGKYEAFEFVSSDKLPVLEKATFKILSISMY
ncbi:DUF2892 domain-containing protein [Bulleidia sp. zg-1006]|uniref:DUF2892 domain-containing protein n=1 Tax=Bulleidia sp. zg-1006 TaxID=2806552 RepID=UPI001939494F|nr:DUF2892 domain-containing protein [Bulleidia sp. zg-1006]QRG86677.1 DUF2892 domain-containing protein [Bulleidia sp. zg-1006]